MRLLLLSLLLGLAAARAAERPAEADCVALAGVELDGAGLIGERRRAALAAPWLGRCIDDALVQGLLGAFADDLLARGYVTSRPYLLPQDIGDGVIDIAILPGRIEAVVDADGGATGRRLAGAFAGVGDILDLRELETALETLERPRSVSAGFDLRPGATQGGSIVAVRLQEARPLSAELSAHARSDIDSGLGLGLDWDNPLGINDTLALAVNQGEALVARQSSRGAEIAYRVGLGALLLELAVDEIEFEQRIQGIADSFVATGETRRERLRVGGVAWRGGRARLDLALSLTLADTRNFFAGEPVDVSSYRTSQVAFETRPSWRTPRGSVALGLTLHRGLDDFGARDDDWYTRGGNEAHAARLQFAKTTLEATLQRWLAADRWQWRSALFAQHSDDLLFDGDKLNLGGLGTVRGYSSALAGANAAYWRNDLVRHFRAAPGKHLSLALGVDHGEVECEADNPDACGHIDGAALAIVAGDANFSASLNWGHPLRKLADGVGDEDLWQADLRWRW